MSQWLIIMCIVCYWIKNYFFIITTFLWVKRKLVYRSFCDQKKIRCSVKLGIINKHNHYFLRDQVEYVPPIIWILIKLGDIFSNDHGGKLRIKWIEMQEFDNLSPAATIFPFPLSLSKLVSCSVFFCGLRNIHFCFVHRSTFRYTWWKSSKT